MNQYKRLLGNVGLLTLSNFASKILTFILVPLYTSILSTEEFGSYDMVVTSVSLCVPILTLSIQDGVMRYSLEENADHKQIFSVGMKFFVIGCVIIGCVVLLNYIFHINEFLMTYGLMFFGYYIVSSLGGIISYFVRGLGKIKYISIGSCLSVAATIGFNILFLLVLKAGLTGYFLANIIGQLIPILYYFFQVKLWKYISLRGSDKTFEKKIVKYSTPMIANTISWWVNGAADRYFITFFNGLGATGIYSVAHKIPTILTTVQNIFGQAWTISAVQDFDANDKTGFYSNTYAIYNCILVLVSSVIIVFNKLLAYILFANEFYEAWRIVPFLIISTLFSGLSSYLGGILSALKKTDTFASTSVITAIINIGINVLLVPKFGAEGAAFATAFAFFVMWILRWRTVRKYVRIEAKSKKNIVTYAILLLQAFITLAIDTDKLFSPIQLIICVIIIILYSSEWYGFIKKVKNKFLARKGIY